MSPSLDNELAEPRQPASIELHSIDYVPDTERHGKVTHLGAIWFVSNINASPRWPPASRPSRSAPASSGPSSRRSSGRCSEPSSWPSTQRKVHSWGFRSWSISPWMQGYLGAAVTVWVFALINYIAYNTSDALLSGDAFHELFGINTNVGYFIAALIAAVIALFGYHWIHRVNRVPHLATHPLVVTLSVAALKDGRLTAETWALGDFQPAPFMTVFVIVAGFQLGWAPYVSDYSRYLPASVGVRSTFWWTYLPSAVSGLWVFALGSIMYAAAGPDATRRGLGRRPSSSISDWLGRNALRTSSSLHLLSVMAINQYGRMMSMISIRDSIKPVAPSRRIRVIPASASCSSPSGSSLGFVGIERFNSFYGNVLIFLAYAFTTWTSINLVDYFFVRRGRYSIKEMFNPHGMYGRWGWRGQAAYLGALVVLVRSWSPRPSPAVSRPRWGTSTTPCSSACRSPQ